MQIQQGLAAKDNEIHILREVEQQQLATISDLTGKIQTVIDQNGQIRGVNKQRVQDIQLLELKLVEAERNHATSIEDLKRNFVLKLVHSITFTPNVPLC